MATPSDSSLYGSRDLDELVGILSPNNSHTNSVNNSHANSIHNSHANSINNSLANSINNSHANSINNANSFHNVNLVGVSGDGDGDARIASSASGRSSRSNRSLQQQFQQLQQQQQQEMQQRRDRGDWPSEARPLVVGATGGLTASTDAPVEDVFSVRATHK